MLFILKYHYLKVKVKTNFKDCLRLKNVRWNLPFLPSLSLTCCAILSKPLEEVRDPLEAMTDCRTCIRESPRWGSGDLCNQSWWHCHTSLKKIPDSEYLLVMQFGRYLFYSRDDNHSSTLCELSCQQIWVWILRCWKEIYDQDQSFFFKKKWRDAIL